MSSSSATRRNCGRDRLAVHDAHGGRSPSAGSASDHCSTSAGASGWSHLKRIWRSKSASVRASRVERRPRTSPERDGADARACRPLGPPAGSSPGRRPAPLLRCCCGELLVVGQIDPEHARRLRRAKAKSRQGRRVRTRPSSPRGDPRAPPADDVSTPSTLCHLDPSREESEQGGRITLVHSGLAGHEREIGDHSGEPVGLGGRDIREHLERPISSAVTTGARLDERRRPGSASRLTSAA